MNKRLAWGLFGVLGIWVTAGIAFPLINLLGSFAPPQLMVFRGFLTAVLALVCLRGRIGKVDRYTWLIAIVLPFATLGLFQSMRIWGVGPTTVVIAATPLVNLLFGKLIGRKAVSGTILSFALVIAGVAIVVGNGQFERTGFYWAIFATLINGALFELFAKAKSSLLQKCFYGSMGMGTLGLIVSIWVGYSWNAADVNIFLLLKFIFVGGFLYWMMNLVAFENLSTAEVSVLAQGETPAVIIGASLLLGEYMTIFQWMGVIIVLIGTMFLSLSMVRAEALNRARE